MGDGMKQKIGKAVDSAFILVPVVGAWLWLSAWVWGGFLREIAL
jgi:hypothetical protein